MIAAARAFWGLRTVRERQLLAVMAALFVIVFVWLAILRPLAAAQRRAEARLQSATVDAGVIAARTQALRSVRPAPPLDQTPQLIVGQSAEAAGFALPRLETQADGRVALSVASAKSPALFAWLNRLEARGLVIDRLTIRPNSDATLGVDAVLRARTP